ncbi:SCO7613 C-terminal domain-containing membrane protein [Streptomyces sp. NBC_00344]|uniref:SCO7613 C-terminal domain-containing membrane protein n=1 Tax=Streptomyces sp. NBC_00344 TaxID=2975720 RepID=UPI002E220126
MENLPPPAQELVLLDRELAQLDARRSQLLTRRAWLLAALRSAPVQPQGSHQTPPGRHAPLPETSPPSAQNVLLALGGVLLTIAAIAFTVVSWGHLGIGGRATVLGALTAAALAAPPVLLRRGLVSTAESVAGTGLALTVLDTYALHQFAARDSGAAAFAAGSAAVLALLWAGYGTALGRLRLPLPAALVAAQLPLLLWASSAGGGALTTGWALLATASFDVAVLLGHKDKMIRVIACAGASGTGGAALLTACGPALSADTAGAAAAPGALLLAGAAVALSASWRLRSTAAAVVAGLAAVAAAGGVVRTAVADEWAPVVPLVCAIGLLAVVRTRVPRPVVRGVVAASCGVQAAVALWALPPVVVAVLAPVARLDRVWAGAPGSLRLPWPALPAAPAALLLIAAVLTVAQASASAMARWRTEAVCGALVLGWGAVLVLPAAASLPWPAAVTLYTALTVAALAASVRLSAAAGAGAPAVTALGCALAGAFAVSMAATEEESATFAVLAVLLVAFAGAAAAPAALAIRTVTACAAVVYATGLAGASGAALGLPPHRTALLVLAVPAVVAGLAARLRRHPLALPAETAAAAAGLVAVALAAGDTASLALVLALGAVITAGTAVRPERRAVGFAAPVLFVLATWVRLADSGVTVPEAYTLPVTVPALAVGLLRRRSDPQASSWTAYGPGLSATLLPSLFAAWGDTHWLRPLLLGAAALGVTLTGARLRLQAPLALGGAVLALDAVHELAPYLVQVAGALPRWLPPALAGMLLLAVGATYEQRLRDARRLRDRLARMN